MIPLTVYPLVLEYHVPNNFREQMAVCYMSGTTENEIKFVRSFLSVGTPVVSGFDDSSPGEDTLSGWNRLDELIEKHSVRGIFHTHPPGVVDFSDQDRQSQIGLAKANGVRLIYHGVQACDCPQAHWIVLNYTGGRVICHDLGWFDSNPIDPIVLLPLPLKLQPGSHDMLVLHY